MSLIDIIEAAQKEGKLSFPVIFALSIKESLILNLSAPGDAVFGTAP